MEELLAAYTRYLVAEKNLSPFTLRNYRSDLLHFARYLEDEEKVPVLAADRLMARRYLGTLKESGMATASLARKVSTIRSFYRWLVREGKVESAPLTGIVSPKRVMRLPTILSKDDMDALEMADETPATFEAFDLLYREGRPVTGWTLRRRKEMLRSLVRPSAAIVVPDWVRRDGVAFFEAAREHELEGIVAKELDSRYLPGQRSRSWLAVKVHQRDEFVIAGYTFGGRWDPRKPSRPAREPLHSLVLGAYDSNERLHYVGEATGGFTRDAAADLAAQLEPLAARECPLAKEPPLERLVFWCRPEVCATVRFGAWTAEQTLSFPVFEAARPDVPAVSCVLPESRR